ARMSVSSRRTLALRTRRTLPSGTQSAVRSARPVTGPMTGAPPRCAPPARMKGRPPDGPVGGARPARRLRQDRGGQGDQLLGGAGPDRHADRYERRRQDHDAAHQIVERGLAHSPEGRHIFPRMTIEENLLLGAYLRKDSAGITDDVSKAYA